MHVALCRRARDVQLYADVHVHVHVARRHVAFYRLRNDLNPSFMQEIFLENESHYNLRSNNDFVQPRVRSVGNGTESVRFKGPQLWQILPQTIRNSESLAQFKANIKDWKGENCPCKLCRTFIPNLGFL